MSGKRILRRFSSSISDLLSLQKKETNEEDEKTTPLHGAVQSGNSVMVVNLLESKTVWIDEEDSRGKTALHYAMEQNNTEITNALLKHGANVECVDYDGTTACHIACRDGMIDNYNMLVYYHADVCSIDKSGRTPFDLACEHGQEKMMETMLTSSIGVEKLKSNENSHTASAFHLAARSGHVQIVSKLLEYGWNLNETRSCGTALHLAAHFGKAQVRGIDVEMKNQSGQTAMEFAKKNSSRIPMTFKEIRFLLKGYKSFTVGKAVQEYSGTKADELSFNVGDQIWVIEKPDNTRWKGIVFGNKGNSRSGWFQASTVSTEPTMVPKTSMGKDEFSKSLPRKKGVDIVEWYKSATLRPKKKNTMALAQNRLSVASISQRGVNPQNGQPIPQMSRQAKMVPMPTVPMSSFKRDANYNPMGTQRPPISYRSPSGLSDSNSDHSNGNRRPNTTTSSNSSLTHSSFCNYGTDTASLLGVTKPLHNNVLSMFPSTSGVDSHRASTGSSSSQASSGFESMKGSTSISSSNSSFHHQSPGLAETKTSRTSVHSMGSGSGSSSVGSSSVHTLDESFHSQSTTAIGCNVNTMVASGVPEAEILANWLDSIQLSEYLSLFLKQGYDLYSIARITPEDLLSLGIKNPDHRKKLISEIHEWRISDNWPATVPQGGLREWLQAISLAEYIHVFECQGYPTVNDILNLTWEDFEDIGVKRLGHLKRIGLAAKKIKEHKKQSMTTMEMVQQQAAVIANQRGLASPRMSRPTGAQSVSNLSYEPLSGSRFNDPPPPAPSSGYIQSKSSYTDKIDYLSYARGSKNAPTPPYRAPVPLEKRKNVRSSYDSIFNEDKPIKLNLVPTGKILSEISKEKEKKDLAMIDFTGDCPPPPAPLFCEAGPLRFLHSNPIRNSLCSSGSTSSADQMPFANENCGTIKAARDVIRMEEPSYPPETKGLASEKVQPAAKQGQNANVLSDIGFMLQNLTDELDALLVSKHPADATTK